MHLISSPLTLLYLQIDLYGTVVHIASITITVFYLSIILCVQKKKKRKKILPFEIMGFFFLL